ncbi:MAG TPA: HNH endonuclease [Ktedonobacterales bacterium]
MRQVNDLMRRAFERFQHHRWTPFWYDFRRLQIDRIQRLFTDPEAVDIEVFTREFWRWGPYIEFESVRTNFLHLKLDTVPVGWPSRLLLAIKSGFVDLHGNYMFQQPVAIFDTNSTDTADKTRRIRKALEVLNDSTLTPEHKAHALVAIDGFGASNATELVSIFHPDTYAVCNLRSRIAVNKLLEAGLKVDHPPLNEIDQFQVLAHHLKAQLVARDLIELDWFFNDISYRDWSANDFAEAFAPLAEADLDAEGELADIPLDSPPDEQGRAEWRKVLRTHLAYERSQALVQQAKKRFKATHGRLYCEVCAFDFSKAYGDLGEGYIEAHHTKPISELNSGDLTYISDLVMVCANCHRMIHRRRPWLRPDELRQLLATAPC